MYDATFPSIQRQPNHPIKSLRRSPLISLGRTEKKCALVQSHRQIEGIDKARQDDVTTMNVLIVAGFKKLVHNHAKQEGSLS